MDACPSDAYGEKEPAEVFPNNVSMGSPFAGLISGKDAYLTNGVKSMHSFGNEVSSVPLWIPPSPQIRQLVAA
jgi:hypothetical protein